MSVGDRGISVRALTKHVFNMSATFFYQPDLEEVKVAVRQYVWRNSRTPRSLLQHIGRRGWYRLNPRCKADWPQQRLDFEADVSDTAASKPAETPRPDLSLSLFDDGEMG